MFHSLSLPLSVSFVLLPYFLCGLCVVDMEPNLQGLSLAEEEDGGFVIDV